MFNDDRMSHTSLPLNLSHLYRMTDDTGIFQHTTYAIPNRLHGYTTDDNARALIVAVKLFAQDKAPHELDLVVLYLSFLYHARDGQGRFRNFMSFERKFLEDTGSEDCFGRCIWALGEVMAHAAILPEGVVAVAVQIFKECRAELLTIRSPRAMGYALIGLKRMNRDDVAIDIHRLASELQSLFTEYSQPDWEWFEPIMTYGNAVLPWALFAAYQVTKQVELLQIAERSLAFLIRNTIREGMFHPIGSWGWYPMGGEAAVYDQQPIEACETILACQEAWNCTPNEQYRSWANTAMDWYHGKNVLGVPMIDVKMGGCFDGLTEQGVNLNQGSESIVSFLLASLVKETWLKHRVRSGN